MTRTCSVTFGFLLAASLVNGQTANKLSVDEGNGGFISFGLELGLPLDVVDVPAWARTVVTHRDDVSSYGPQISRTIPYAEARTAYDSRGFVSGGGHFQLGHSAQMRIGCTASVFLDIDRLSPGNRNVREWGQFADTDLRGGGTSLVFYRVVPSLVVPGFFADLDLGPSDSRAKLTLGYAISLSPLNIQTGWDRYDKLETDETSRLGSDTVHRVYGGITMGAVRFTVGKLFRPQLEPGDAQLAQTSAWSFRLEYTTHR